MERGNSTFRQVGNQLIHTRLLNAPRELVWDVWTKPEHIKEWWGPDGFTLTHKSMEVKPGMVWDFILHGMGQDFDNIIEYIEVVKPSLLSYKHVGNSEDFSFFVTVTFEDQGGKTLLIMKSTFKSAAIIEELNRQVKAIEGGKQTLNRMEQYLKNLTTKTN